VALLTALGLAVSFWPLFYGRATYRAISLPVLAGLHAYFLWRALRRSEVRLDSATWRYLLLSGAFLGGSLYTYMAARILPLISLSVVIYMAISNRTARRLIPGFAVMLLVAALVAAPLVAWLAVHPGAEYRVTEVQAPLHALLEGDPGPVLNNLAACLKFFTIEGDPWPRQNVPGRPAFADPLNAALFYGGLLLSIWRWRDTRYGLLVIWALGALGPSVATEIAPNSIRLILGLVTTFIFPALALDFLIVWGGRRMAPALPGLALAALAVALAGALTLRDYFLRWPLDPTVRFDYQASFTEAVSYTDHLPPGTPVTLAGLSTNTMDLPTLRVTARKDTSDIRLADVRQTIVIPHGLQATLLIPDVVPLDPYLADWLAANGMTREPVDLAPGVIGYLLPPSRQIEDRYTRSIAGLPITFGEALTLLGVEPIPGSGSIDPIPRGYFTIWRVETPPSVPLRVFLHYVDANGTIITQFDGLESNYATWQRGDIIVQIHPLTVRGGMPPYTLAIGVYDPASGTRLTRIEAGADTARIPADLIF